MWKKILIAAVIVGIFGAIYGVYMFNKPVQSIENDSPDYKINSVELLKEFENDEKEANTKYLDKIITVTGEVVKTEEKNDKSSIYLKTNSLMSNVICELEKNSVPETIRKGDKVKVKGLCSGYLMDVILVRSVILN